MIYTQLSGTRVAINIFLMAVTLIDWSKSIDTFAGTFVEAVVAIVVVVAFGLTATAVVMALLQLLLLFVKYEPSIKSWDGTFVVTDFNSRFFGRFSWPEYLMSYWIWQRQKQCVNVQHNESRRADEKNIQQRRRKKREQNMKQCVS